jgi:putative transcriptional regulator
MNNLSIILGTRLITIGEVVEGTGLSRSTVSAVYHRRADNVKLKTLTAICDYLGVPLHELVEYEPKESEA